MCHTSGYRQCDSCLGTGQLKWFLELVVNFTNHVDDFLKDTAVDDIPDSVIRLARAELLFEEINLRVQAINHHSDPDINKSSASLISKHQLQFGNQKILSQVAYDPSRYSNHFKRFKISFFSYVNRSTRLQLFP